MEIVLGKTPERPLDPPEDKEPFDADRGGDDAYDREREEG